MNAKNVRSLNTKKPLGPSNIPSWAPKDSLNVIAEPPTILINAVLEQGKLPNHLKRAHVVTKMVTRKNQKIRDSYQKLQPYRTFLKK